KRVPFVKDRLKPARLKIKRSIPAPATINGIVLRPADQRVGKCLDTADKIERVIVPIHKVDRIIRTFDKRAVIHHPTAPGKLPLAGGALRQKTCEPECATVDRMPQ